MATPLKPPAWEGNVQERLDKIKVITSMAFSSSLASFVKSLLLSIFTCGLRALKKAIYLQLSLFEGYVHKLASL